MPSSHGYTNMHGPGLLSRALLVGWLSSVLFLTLLKGSATGESMMVKDALGQYIRVTPPLQRIVALNSDILEVLRTLRAENLVVGVFSEIVREREFWGDLAERPKVGSWRDPDMEAIASLKPDLVIAYGWNPGPSLERNMALFGIQVLRLDFYKVNELEREVRIMGQLLKREEEAERFCNWHRRHIGRLQEKIAGTPDLPAVYIESYTDFHAAGPGSGGHEMCVLAGGRNIAAGFSIPYPRVTSEWVVVQNPEAIVKAASYGNGYALKGSKALNRRREAILRRPAWRHISAVASGNVHVMDSAVWTGPRAVVGIAHMARWFHHVLFPDLDPKALHRKYLQTFQGMDCRGAFVSDHLQEAGR